MPNLNVFFIHGEWLSSRNTIIQQFTERVKEYTFSGIDNVNVNIVKDYDVKDINNEVISSKINTGPLAAPYDSYNQFLKPLHFFNVSCALKHYEAIRSIAETSNTDDFNIVLEDDVIFDEKIAFLLDNFFENLKESGRLDDVVFLGLPTNISKKDESISFQNTKEVFKHLPFCDSYFMSKETAQKLCKEFIPLKFTANIQLNYVLERSNVQSFLVIPNIFMDGSKYGMSCSSQVPNNSLIFNKDYIETMNFLNKKTVTQEEVQNLLKMFENSPIKKHPDFMHLKAITLSKLGQFETARKIYEETFEIYKANNCIVNKESDFLNNYISLFRNLQTDVF